MVGSQAAEDRKKASMTPRDGLPIRRLQPRGGERFMIQLSDEWWTRLRITTHVVIQRGGPREAEEVNAGRTDCSTNVNIIHEGQNDKSIPKPFLIHQRLDLNKTAASRRQSSNGVNITRAKKKKRREKR